MKRYITILSLAMIFLTLSTGCTPKNPTAIPAVADLTINVLYPLETTEVEMGQLLKSIIRVSDNRGEVVDNARVTLAFRDPDDNLMASLPAIYGSGNVYRTDTWAIPHKMREGNWTLTVEAKTDTHAGTATRLFHVTYSLSEMLLNKYGFWVDSPALRGINPTLVKEQGDVQNGAITWGGVIPTQHVFPESWLEVQWRLGNFDLTTAEDVRQFMLSSLGNPGFYPTRDLESFEQTKFKNWNAWKVKARGQLLRYDEQWMIFYAPEVNKTYALGTTVVLAPVGIDAHTVLREDFEVHPEIQANGIAPKPLLHMLPPVELLSPELGTRFFGTDQPIILKWKPAKELTVDEYYQVSIDYNYVEANLSTDYATRETQFVLPESFYRVPNCGIFNWRVTLMHQTGLGPEGGAESEPVSFNSLYWYVQWLYPPGQETPFKPLCPNEQY